MKHIVKNIFKDIFKHKPLIALRVVGTSHF